MGRQDFWNYKTASTTVKPAADANLGEVPLASLMAAGIGARYGQFTGAANTTTAGQLNPILVDGQDDDEGGWYWIEVLPYSDKHKSANVVVDTSTDQLPLNLDVHVVYRITAVAMGRKPSSTVVLQQTYARQRLKD